MSWRIRDGEGRVNWGLLAFLGLASACVAVWGALLAQYAVYRRWGCGNCGSAGRLSVFVLAVWDVAGGARLWLQLREWSGARQAASSGQVGWFGRASC
jgi:hypothetical protein